MNLAVLLFCATCVLSEPLVRLPNGITQGESVQTFTGRSYNSFRSIPYAKPPLGNLRFQPPDPNVTWDGVLLATKDSNICYQMGSNNHRENEDCLYLNVFTPVLNPGANQTKLPVMFLIHGGGYTHGSCVGTRPEYIMDEDVIVVTHNYRLGPFGFLSTGDKIMPGNAGLKDQNLALQWTKNNIALFGGDPDKITILGQSAGGASVGHHILSPKSAGLFRAGISESGSPLNIWGFTENPMDYTLRLSVASGNGQKGNDSLSLLQFLQSIPGKQIDVATSKIRGMPNIVIEPNHPDAILTRSMFESFEKGEFFKVPFLIGINSEEYLAMANNIPSLKNKARLYDTRPDLLVPPMLPLKKDANKTKLGQIIKRIYIKDNETFSDHLGRVIRYSSDNSFTRGIIKQAKMMSKFVDVYFYQFSYVGDMGGRKHGYIDDAEKVMHGEESKYIFTPSPLTAYNESDIVTHKRMVNMWTSFVKNLNPTPEKSELLQNIIWPKITPEKYQYLDIDQNLAIKLNPKGNYFLKWETVLDKYGQRPFVTY